MVTVVVDVRDEMGLSVVFVSSACFYNGLIMSLLLHVVHIKEVIKVIRIG